MEYVFIFIAAVFVNNIVLAQFLGICPFLGVSKSVPTALGMTGAVTFVMILATLVTFIVQKTVLDPFGIGFMQTIVFILIIAALVQMVEIILKKVSPSLYQALGVFLPLITTNCAVLGVAIMVIAKTESPEMVANVPMQAILGRGYMTTTLPEIAVGEDFIDTVLPVPAAQNITQTKLPEIEEDEL